MRVTSLRAMSAAAGAALLLGLTACSSSTPSGRSAPGTTTPTTPAGATSPVPCQSTGCQARQTLPLAAGYQVVLWLSPDQQNFRTRPVVELRHNGAAVGWWTSPKGDGWSGQLTCSTSAAEPNCVLTDTAGMHAGVAEVVLLSGGRLVHPAGAEATSDSGLMHAADLDGDGYLDVVGATNDYQPNYAQGHNYWQTFRYAEGQLVVTGCQLQVDTPRPTRLLAGPCPPI
ncbi:MAG TPA: hypothetical protein VH373_13685 [Jatrophihabitantaceae bacterium]|jgi:hypothetical protein